MSEIAAYIDSLDLPTPGRRGPGEPPTTPPTFNGDKQALAIGSQLTEFTTQVAQVIRPAVSNSLLLAQLAADRANSGNGDSKAWFTTFNTALGKVGWLPVGDVRTTQQVTDRDAELHKAIIPVLTAVLGPAAAAGSIIISVLQGLQAMNEDSPWLTLFSRKSQTTQMAQFGINFIDGGDGGAAGLTAIYFSLTATNIQTQILFLKLSDANATVTGERREAILSAAAISEAQGALQDKLGSHIADNIKNIDIGS